jgi:predicted metal-dependent phosphoesterase TrpH
MLKADLHIHSTVSDGSDSIEKLVKAAEEKDLDFIAITDHDTLSHLKQIPNATKVKVIGGIEISAVDPTNNSRAHILGYNIKNAEIVEALTKPILEARNLNSEKQAKILYQNGYEIDIDKLSRADGKYLYKQHIMDYLVKTKQVPDMFGMFYYTTFKNKGICDFDIKYINVYEAVKTITQVGGQAVLAHSGQQKNFYLIPSLKEFGLAGLEYNHHANSDEDKEIIRKYAENYNLFLTGGSDYHGRYEPQDFGVGDIISEESGVQAICMI